MSDFNSFLKEQLKDEKVKAEYDALEDEFEKVQEEIDAKKVEKNEGES